MALIMRRHVEHLAFGDLTFPPTRQVVDPKCFRHVQFKCDAALTKEQFDPVIKAIVEAGGILKAVGELPANDTFSIDFDHRVGRDRPFETGAPCTRSGGPAGRPFVSDRAHDGTSLSRWPAWIRVARPERPKTHLHPPPPS